MSTDKLQDFRDRLWAIHSWQSRGLDVMVQAGLHTLINEIQDELAKEQKIKATMQRLLEMTPKK